jgi:hypothetical protein
MRYIFIKRVVCFFFGHVFQKRTRVGLQKVCASPQWVWEDKIFKYCDRCHKLNDDYKHMLFGAKITFG